MEWCCRNWRKHEKTGWQVSRRGSMAPCPCTLKFQNSILRQISSDIEEVAGPWHVFIRLFAAVGRSAAFLRVGPRPARVDRLKADGEHLVSPFYLTMYLCAYSQTTSHTWNRNNNNFESSSHAFFFDFFFSFLFFPFLFFSFFSGNVRYRWQFSNTFANI